MRQSGIVLLLLTLVVMGTALSPTHKRRVDRLVEKVMQCAKIPALGLALIGLEDRYQYTNAYGSEDVAAPEKRSTADTRFCLGGATEAFTAVMLARLIQENENVTWSTPIQDILGHRVVLSETYRSLNLNLKDIFAQRSGYPNMDIVSVVRPYTSYRLVSYLRYVQPVAGFREKYVPNQVLFSLLDDVVRSLGDANWETLVRELVLKPLKMNSVMSLGGKNSADVSNVAYPVIFHNDQPISLPLQSFKGLRLTKQANSLCLSPADMSRWIRFLLRGKGADGQQLVDMDVLQEIFQGVQSRGHSDDPAIVGYRQPFVQVSYVREQNALGFITGHYRGYQFVSQDGSIPGAQTLATILPDRKVAVFTSFTGKGGSEGLAAKTLINLFGLDVLMKGSTWFDDSNVCTILEQMKGMYTEDSTGKHDDVEKTSQHPGERPLSDFVGQYRNFAYGDITIRFNSTAHQLLFMEYGDGLYRMKPTNKNNTFQLVAQGLLWYTTDSDSTKEDKIIAVFLDNPRDPGHRIHEVVISGFDKTGDVVFSHNPTPPRYGSFHVDCPHDDGASTMTSTFLLVTSLMVSVTVFFR